MLWVVTIAVGVLLLAIVVLAFMKPDQLQLTRSIQIGAAPDHVFTLINDLRAWHRWHPQQNRTPPPELVFGAVSSGVGATCEWKGAGQVGEGHMQIAHSEDPRCVRLDVRWRKPFVAHNINDFSLEPAADGTRVTWSMIGPNLLPMKIMSMFVSMDRMMGRHFDEGLAALKKVAESVN